MGENFIFFILLSLYSKINFKLKKRIGMISLVVLRNLLH